VPKHENNGFSGYFGKIGKLTQKINPEAGWIVRFSAKKWQLKRLLKPQ
jgi:hypothetical protein